MGLGASSILVGFLIEPIREDLTLVFMARKDVSGYNYYHLQTRYFFHYTISVVQESIFSLSFKVEYKVTQEIAFQLIEKVDEKQSGNSSKTGGLKKRA